ncbi:TPR-like protein [Dendrothele bispora CBS 962.96]|uniref:TPR-like protein n=1 Tax=Dendrothele bispora (strain CBS 962.96) TaxID=1314807 RepID=A0A4S8LNC6_DENBC|nr:TPR-like protein [Dendrothele bispora CBS 962.96]
MAFKTRTMLFASPFVGVITMPTGFLRILTEKVEYKSGLREISKLNRGNFNLPLFLIAVHSYVIFGLRDALSLIRKLVQVVNFFGSWVYISSWDMSKSGLHMLDICNFPYIATFFHTSGICLHRLPYACKKTRCGTIFMTAIKSLLNNSFVDYGPNAIDMFAILSLLPDGLSKGLLDKFQTHLPRDFSLRTSLASLQRVSLAYTCSNRTNNPEQIQLLSPIRHFCREKLPKQETLVIGLIDFYTQSLNTDWEFTDDTLHKTVPQELLNLHLVLHDAFKAEQVDPSLMEASINFMKWSLFMGNPVEDIIQLATDTKAEVPGEGRANCLLCLAEVFLYRDKLDEAEESLNQAVELHQQAQDVHREADLHQHGHSILGEANDLSKLGDVFLPCSKLDEAKKSLNRAVELHQQGHSILGEANDLSKLGDVFLLCSKLDEAKKSLNRAVELHQQAQHDLQTLGEVLLRRDKLDEAEESLNRAVELHKQTHSVLGEANDLSKLGDVFLLRSKLDEAEKSLNRAVELHRQAQHVLGEANDLQMLGQVLLLRSKLDEAEESLDQAVELH